MQLQRLGVRHALAGPLLVPAKGLGLARCARRPTLVRGESWRAPVPSSTACSLPWPCGAQLPWHNQCTCRSASHLGSLEPRPRQVAGQANGSPQPGPFRAGAPPWASTGYFTNRSAPGANLCHHALGTLPSIQYLNHQSASNSVLSSLHSLLVRGSGAVPACKQLGLGHRAVCEKLADSAPGLFVYREPP
jgi:hypothetical protein